MVGKINIEVSSGEVQEVIKEVSKAVGDTIWKEAEISIEVRSEFQKRIKKVEEGLGMAIDKAREEIEREIKRNRDNIGELRKWGDKVSELKGKIGELDERISEVVRFNNLKEQEHIT